MSPLIFVSFSRLENSETKLSGLKQNWKMGVWGHLSSIRGIKNKNFKQKTCLNWKMFLYNRKRIWVCHRDRRRAGFCPGFATRPGNPGSGSQILNSGFRAGLDFGSGFRVPGRKPGIFWIFFYLRVKNGSQPAKSERLTKFSGYEKNWKKNPKNYGPGRFPGLKIFRAGFRVLKFFFRDPGRVPGFILKFSGFRDPDPYLLLIILYT